MGVPCFLLEPTDRERRWLRRYARVDSVCPADPARQYHDAQFPLRDGPVIRDAQGYHTSFKSPAKKDPRWPRRCECGYRFTKDDPFQPYARHIYVRADTGAELTLWDVVPGMMWDAWWYPWKGPDGRSLVVRCPNGREWMIDGPASNCTMPDDSGQTRHHCWVRHGDPPNITVDKNGPTCAAGAGSIQAGDYHGFLVGGVFT